MEEVLKTEASFDRMRAIFAEREKEYNAREEEFKQRRAAFTALEEKLRREKEEITSRETELKSRETELSMRLDELAKKRTEVQEMEERLKKERTEFDTEKSNAYLDVKLAKEELQNEMVKVKRQSEQLEFQKEMGNIGVEVIPVNTDDYIPKEDLKNYILCAEVEERYILKTEHEKEVCRLKEANQNLQQAKAELFRKMFGGSAASEKETVKEEDYGSADREAEWTGAGDKKDNEESESSRDLTAESLKEALLERTDYNAPRVRHADEGDLVEVKKGEAVCCFVFAEPPYFDITFHRKESKRLLALLERLREKYPDVTFTCENGEVRMSGYFVRSISVPSLLKEIEEISESFLEQEKRHGR